jgi:HAT1-interacting factor 1
MPKLFYTEKFEQAIQDYEAGLELKIELLPQSSRQIAEAHYKLSIVLDLSSGRLQESILHAEKALESVESRLAELRNAMNGQMKVETLQKPDSKGKGKSPVKGPRLLGDDAVANMTQPQVSAEIKELEGLKEDLALKVCLVWRKIKTVADIFEIG